MNEKVQKIAGDLEALLENTKAKPVVIDEDNTKKELSEQIITEESFAKELATEVLRNIPHNALPEDVSFCLRKVAEVKSKQYGISKDRVLEAVIDYCLTMVESLSEELDS